MAQSILVFDFGTNEEDAQQARHKVEAWKQGFRLGNKMMLKFEREDTATPNLEVAEPAASEAEKTTTSAAKAGKKKAIGKAGGKSNVASKAASEKKETAGTPQGKVRLLVRLDFSDHEKLSHQRWLDRIPAEEPFKSASGQTIRAGDPEFPKTAELFDSLD